MIDRLNLAFGFQFNTLHSLESLLKLDELFITSLPKDLADGIKIARLNHCSITSTEHSELIIQLAPYLDDFLGTLFDIKQEITTLSWQHNELAMLYQCKRLFVQRQAVKKYNREQVAALNYNKIKQDIISLVGSDGALEFAKCIMFWLVQPDIYHNQLELAMQYAAYRVYFDSSVLFSLPKKIDWSNLVQLKRKDNTLSAQDEHIRNRDGFKLTDHGCDLTYALDQTHYCIYCHNQGKDSCSKGYKDKDGNYKKNELGSKLFGCPLEEKISEMNKLKAEGWIIGSLATAMIDNPMLAATGHRICNDCMKACIYQKQEPVNIPQIETRVLKDVLNLPWGVEIYNLLTLWNPLDIKQPLPLENSGYKTLVVGLGPAGFTLAHYLSRSGHAVIAIDGLKIEPIPASFLAHPIHDIKILFKELDERVQAGFGGVAEYGITVRWNKNYLQLIQLILTRRHNIAIHGGIRFGSNITYQDAINLGFDHVALAIGAGSPNILNIPNGLARGVRTASDFLMSLQLLGPSRMESIANLQVRLPVIVIGGGLTAIDAATEALAYYPIQVEKFLTRYEEVIAIYGEAKVRADWSKEEQIIAGEFISHAKLLREYKGPNTKLLRDLGGVSITYRKNIKDSPSYRLNHEEVELAMKEGIYFMENVVPTKFLVDEYEHVSGIATADGNVIDARSILIAAGTTPNTMIANEDSDNFKLDGVYFKAVNQNGEHTKLENSPKPKEDYVLMKDASGENRISFFGDTHPSYAGNVVKAMASAKNGYPIINNQLVSNKPLSEEDYSTFFNKVEHLLCATVKEIIILAEGIIEIIIHAPLAANHFKPGQFYRLQNYHATNSILMEGIALTGATVDKDNGDISLIVLEMGGSSNLCRQLKPGDSVVLMGPTGEPTEIVSNQTVILIGGGLGNAVLFSIGKALREAGSKVIYFAGYRKLSDRVKIAEIEQAADRVIWCCDEGELSITREGDYSFHGNIIDAIKAYTGHELNAVNRVIAIGSDRMMNAVNEARFKILKTEHTAIASINSPMQCMMKGICAQCLQMHEDPNTGMITYVYSCVNQDQDMNKVNFKHLNQRLKQNSLSEKLTKMWLLNVSG
jgi:NADPH-dependent glutamate synthase beta subunit-like oxidoreductase/NAD(P)H-flavin reductase